MNVDHQNYAITDWRPPSPTSATPQSGKLASYQFQSPMASESSPTNFQNAWMTPQSNAFENYSNVGNPWPSNYHTEEAFSQPPFSNAENSQPLASQGTNVLQTGLQMQIPQPSPYIGSSVPLIDISPVQMQTPPPTRDSTNKRKPPQPHLQNLQAASSVSSRRLSSPSSAWLRRSIEFPSFESSPLSEMPFQASDSMQFSFGAAATAPIYQPSNLFWDPNTSSNFDLPAMSDLAEDPFVSNNTSQNAGILRRTQTSRDNRPSTAVTKPILKRHETARPRTSLGSESQFDVSKQRPHSSSFISFNGSVDPSLLMSSQEFDLDGGQQATSSTFNPQTNRRQPYEHQLEHARREKELDRSRRSFTQHPRPNTLSVDTFTAHPGLRRSLTDSRAKRSGGHSHNPSFVSAAGIHDITQGLRDAHIPRTASPLKRHKSDARRNTNILPKPVARKSLVLTVDEKGRARTEIKTVETLVDTQIEDSASSQWEASSASSSDSDDVLLSSQMSSSAVTETSSNQLEVGSRASRRAARSLISDFSMESAPQTQAKTSDAQAALREVVKGRQERRRASQADQITPRNESGSRSARTNRIQVIADTAPFGTDQHQASWQVSATDLMQPSSLQHVSNDLIRCVCSANHTNQGHMIQCDSCNLWLHANCIGLGPENFPPVYICIFCSQTPARGGRMRSRRPAQHQQHHSFQQELNGFI